MINCSIKALYVVRVHVRGHGRFQVDLHFYSIEIYHVLVYNRETYRDLARKRVPRPQCAGDCSRATASRDRSDSSDAENRTNNRLRHLQSDWIFTKNL